MSLHFLKIFTIIILIKVKCAHCLKKKNNNSQQYGKASSSLSLPLDNVTIIPLPRSVVDIKNVYWGQKSSIQIKIF